MPRPLALRLALLVGALLPPAASAQLVAADTLAPPPNTETLDIRAFRAIYEITDPVFVTTVQQANVISKPVFLMAVPVSAALAAATRSSYDPTLRLAATQAGATALIYALKGTVRRPRPYRGLEGIEYRAQEHNPDRDPFSFPSGHAGMAFAIATSTALSYPEWYVIVPAYLWASATSVARVWHGVHYPSDIVTGAVLGAGAATLVYLFLPRVDEDEEEGAPLLVNLRFGL